MRTKAMGGFAVTENRLLKAKKIESVLTDYLNREITGLNILDIGAGNGVIGSYFIDKQNSVTCVDLENNTSDSRINFVKVETSKLPFKSEIFDIVISNHVIEHVSDQAMHVDEIKRVLKKNGICYMATPNRNFPVEPHYKLPFLHYLPRPAFNNVLKTLGIFKEDLFLLSHKQMLYQFADFAITEYSARILKEPKKYFFKETILSKLPITYIKNMNPIYPTNIFILKK